MEGLKLGQRPPELAEDGSFNAGYGLRVHSIVDEEGRILSVDKATGLLAKDEEDESSGGE